MGDNYDTVLKTSSSNTNELENLRQELSAMATSNTKLHAESVVLQENIIDLKCRSMRDNLVFLGISETSRQRHPMNQSTDAMEASTSSGTGSYAQAAAPEDCVAKIYDFCESVLKIEDAKSKIQIDRAHRMGSSYSGKTRAIVAKFKDTDSKMCIKAALRDVNLRSSGFGVHDQLPQEVQERRKALIPIMVKAREEGKRAFLVRDKLFINNREYKSDSG